MNTPVRALFAAVLSCLLCGTLFPQAADGSKKASLFDSFAKNNRIDEIVLAQLKKKGVPPSATCSDEVFLRRAFLDVIGTLPTPVEAGQFLRDKNPKKRAKLIDSLLERPEFADYWGLKWGDLLRVKAEFPSNLWPNAVQAYDLWIRDRLRENMPYDKFVRALLVSTGSNFRDPPCNFYRAFQERTPQAVAENVALVFMGLRLNQSGFSEEGLLGFSAFFARIGYKATAEWKEEIVFHKPDGQLLHPATQKPVQPKFLGGGAATIPEGEDPRVVFADWLASPKNPWFARAISNRTWYWLTGRGIVHEPDDMRLDNAPWSPELLSFLEKELVAHDFDLKRLFRLILNSNTWQLSSETNEWNRKDDSGFSHCLLRQLDAEVLIDAINKVTGSGDQYSSDIPEPFTWLPINQRAIRIADGSITSSFLELFGRPPRNTSFESERAPAPSPTQAQHLLNSSHIQDKLLKSQTLRRMLNARGREDRKLEMMYLGVLSRLPTEEEKKVSLDYVKNFKGKPADALGDLVWALINTKEFILRH